MAYRVLIADDALFMRTLLKDIFKGPEYTIVGEAQSGPEAIEQYFKLKPDFMTMDIVMPFKNGIEAVREIKSHDQAARIIICSALGQEQMVSDAMKAGAAGFVTKPFDENKVLAAVHQIFPV